MNITKLVCLGDSLTDGYGLPLSDRWSDLLEAKTKIAVINKGISGDTTGGMLARIYQDVLAHKPSHVIIMGGTNDLSLNLPIPSILSNIHAMTRQARHYNIESIIGIPTPYYPPQPTTKSEIFVEGDALSIQLQDFNKKLIQMCIEDNRPYIDFSIHINKAHFIEDGLHPNEAGQKIMMQNVCEALSLL